jgi:hypothetical protein
MKWTVAKRFEEANHHPVAAIEKSIGTDVVIKRVKAGRTIKIDATRSYDPDGNTLTQEMIFYKEPSSYKGTVQIVSNKTVHEVGVPLDAKGKSIHLILRVTDNGHPTLTSYRRIVLVCR